MDPRKHHVLDVLPLPLGAHVAHAMDSHEVHPIVLGDVARDLSIGVVRPPVLQDRPPKFLDPPPGSIGGHDSVRVSREDQYPVLPPQLRVDPDGPLRQQLIVNGVPALLEHSYVVSDVQRLPHVLPVRILHHEVSQHRRLQLCVRLPHPGGVLLHGEPSTVAVGLSIQFHSVIPFCLRQRECPSVGVSEQVIHIQFRCFHLELRPGFIAGDGGDGRDDAPEAPEAPIVSQL
mmetsp:Transcript_30407/g.29761  ORF Transcript_30407/g.29761 Transcript_30407/m.29761 type:complete len:231 (+) Transcript_30407:42-734(+)